MLSTRLVRSLFGRVNLAARKVVRHRLEVMALESRWLPSTITQFPLPPLSFGGAFGALNIAAAPDGNLWFTDPVANDIGRITPAGQVTEFPGLSGEGDITAGPDGNLWFTAGGFFNSSIGRITPNGQLTVFALPNQPEQANAITAGPDGNLWFTENIYPTGEKIGRITPAGQITEFTVPVPPGVSGHADGITVGPDGSLWFLHDGILATITPSGALRDHVADAVGTVLASGPDGNLWTGGTLFNTQTGEALNGFIDRITLSGEVTTFSLGTAESSPRAIRPGPDGNLWFTEPGANKIGRITPAGQTTLFAVPTAGSQPVGITAGPNGNLWFTENGTRQIGEYFLTGTPPAAAAPTATALATDLSAPAVGQTVHVTATVTSTAGTPSGTVTFFDGRTAVGTAALDAGGHAMLATSFATAGSHTLVAVFDGTTTFAPSRSAALQETVSQAATTTTLAASANPAPTGKPLTLTVTVTPAFAGAGTPMGIVIFRDGSTVIGIASLNSSGVAVLTLIPGQTTKHSGRRSTLLARGTHQLTASFVGDDNFAASMAELTLLVV